MSAYCRNNSCLAAPPVVALRQLRQQEDSNVVCRDEEIRMYLGARICSIACPRQVNPHSHILGLLRSGVVGGGVAEDKLNQVYDEPRNGLLNAASLGDLRSIHF